MMVERITGSRLVIPLHNIRLRRDAYCSTRAMSTRTTVAPGLHILDAAQKYIEWTTPDFTDQCEIMDLLCNVLY